MLVCALVCRDMRLTMTPHIYFSNISLIIPQAHPFCRSRWLMSFRFLPVSLPHGGWGYRHVHPHDWLLIWSHACIARTLPSEPSPQTLKLFFSEISF